MNSTLGVLTNVHGPPITIYLAGALVEGIASWAPVSGDQPISFSAQLHPAAIALSCMAESKSVKRSATAVASFLVAQRYTRDEVFAEPSPVPAEAGAHGWWFRDTPARSTSPAANSGTD